MKILQINKYYYPRAGAERYMLEVSKLLTSRGHEVVPWGMHHPLNNKTSWSKYFVKEKKFDQKEGLGKDVAKAMTMIWSRESASKLKQLLKKFRPDIAHVHNIYHHISPSILSVLKKEKIPVVWTAHDFKWICPNYKLFTEGSQCERCHVYRYWNAVIHKCVQDSRISSAAAALEMGLHRIGGWYERDVARVVTPSAFLRHLFGKWGKDLSKITHLPNFLDRTSLSNVENSLGESVLYVGRLAEEKGVLTVLQMAASLPKVSFKFVGGGPLADDLRVQAKALGVKNVHFLGFLSGDALWKEIANARMVLVPSLWFENFPYAVLEAMALGKVVLASNTGGIPEIIRHERSGFLLPAGDVPRWVDTIRKIYDNSGLLEEIGAEAAREVTRFSPDRHYDGLMEIYAHAQEKNKYQKS